MLALKNRMDSLNHEIAERRAQLAELESELQGYRGAMSAIRRLPLDVLGGVFLCVSPSPEEVVNIGLVCRRWREAALLTHRLWSKVVLKNPRELSEGSYARIVTWFNRSGATYRRLWITEACGRGACAPPNDCHLLNSMVVKLLTQGPGIDKLCLGCKERRCFRRLLKAISQVTSTDMEPQPWNAIRALKLAFDDASTWMTGDPPPQLQETTFCSLPSSITYLSLWLPSAYEAHEHFRTVAEFMGLEMPAPLLKGLTRLKISCDWKGGPIYPIKNLLRRRGIIPSSGISLRKLRILAFRNLVDLEALTYLVTPALGEMDIDLERSSDHIMDDKEIYGHFRRFLDRSKCRKTLHTLHLRRAAFSPDGLAAIVLEFTSLNCLTLDRAELRWFQFWQILADKLWASRAPRRDRDSGAMESTFSFLHQRGPEACQFVISYESLPKIPDEARIEFNWQRAAKCGSQKPSTPLCGSLGFLVFGALTANRRVRARTIVQLVMERDELAHLVRTNYTPSPGEAASLKNRMDGVAHEIAQTRARLLNLETKFEGYRGALTREHRIGMQAMAGGRSPGPSTMG
ncbi:hypothetical protein NMY22_g13863 [Coprinellus aureogranulatus]|nr:hypothetical protein NMY22_g13863 [Coprinellus aureogranulatus]